MAVTIMYSTGVCVFNLINIDLQVVRFSDTQHKVSAAVNDFQRLSREIMLSLQGSGPGSSRSRRRKQRYKVVCCNCCVVGMMHGDTGDYTSCCVYAPCDNNQCWATHR